MISLSRLRVFAGQKMTGAAFKKMWDNLLTAIEERTVKSVKGGRCRRSPDGVVIITEATESDTITFPWQVSLGSGDNPGEFDVSFLRGLLNGVEAQISVDGELTPMSQVDDTTGELPTLVVTQDDFDATGVSRIYAKTTFAQLAWYTDTVELIASSKVMQKEAWIFYKLIALLVMDDGVPDVEQMAFFDLSVTPIQQRASGLATYITGIAA